MRLNDDVADLFQMFELYGIDVKIVMIIFIKTRMKEKLHAGRREIGDLFILSEKTNFKPGVFAQVRLQFRKIFGRIDVMLDVSGVIEHRVVANFQKNIFLVDVIHRRDNQEKNRIKDNEQRDETDQGFAFRSVQCSILDPEY